MYNSSSLSNNIYGDIFKMREILIKDMLLKNNLEKIKNRPINSRGSLLILPNNNKIIKRSKSPNQNIITPTKGNIHTSNRGRLSPIKTSNGDIISKSLGLGLKNKIPFEDKYENHKNYVSHFLQAKKRDQVNKSVLLDLENIKFGRKLISINSNINYDKLNECYSRSQKYRDIAKKLKNNNKEINLQKINNLKFRLPPLLVKEVTKKIYW